MFAHRFNEAWEVSCLFHLGLQAGGMSTGSIIRDYSACWKCEETLILPSKRTTKSALLLSFVMTPFLDWTMPKDAEEVPLETYARLQQHTWACSTGRTISRNLAMTCKN